MKIRDWNWRCVSVGLGQARNIRIRYLLRVTCTQAGLQLPKVIWHFTLWAVAPLKVVQLLSCLPNRFHRHCLVQTSPGPRSFASEYLPAAWKRLTPYRKSCHITGWTPVNGSSSVNGDTSFLWEPRVTFWLFSGSPVQVRPPNEFHTKWLKRRGFTQGCAFWSKNRYFSYPRSPGPLYNLEKMEFENFTSISSFTSEGHGENTPYSSSEPNKSDIVNMQSGGDRLTYILKSNYDSALCLWAHEVWGIVLS